MISNMCSFVLKKAVYFCWFNAMNSTEICNTIGSYVSLSHKTIVLKCCVSIKSTFYTTCSYKWVTLFIVGKYRNVTGRRAGLADSQQQISVKFD